jgi:predicted O-methyltransferase YrrM
VEPDVLEQLRRVVAPETDALAVARARAQATAMLPAPEVGALLRFAAAHTRARTVVEVGSAAGVSGLWLLSGLADGGVLTSIEPDAHTHALAADAYADGEVAERVRSILGDPMAVLPRLSDGGYDLMLVQSTARTTVDTLDHAHRLLRPGGLYLARGVLAPGNDADLLAQFVADTVEDERFHTTLLPFDDGILLAERRAEEA